MTGGVAHGPQIRQLNWQYACTCGSILGDVGTQDARLNYVEQHAERIGLDSGRLENLRVAASKSSPMSDTLDLCARYADAPSLEALVPALCQLVKRGVGVNTRVGSARFVASLATRMGSDIRPHAATMLKVWHALPLRPRAKCCVILKFYSDVL